MSNLNSINYDAPIPTTLDDLRSLLISIFKMIESDSITGLPDNSKRYNSSTNKFEKFNQSASSWTKLPFHDAIDNHIANGAIHSGVPVGSIVLWPSNGLPSPDFGEWVRPEGQAISRTEYVELYGFLGFTYGNGNGVTTFTLPDMRGRIPIGIGSDAAINALNKKTGSLHHTHVQTAHTHTVDAHMHSIAGHTHSIPAHSHLTAPHAHIVPRHYHKILPPGDGLGSALIIIGGVGGAHQHLIPGRNNASPGSGPSFMKANPATGSEDNGGATVNDNFSNHGHSAIIGTVGAVTGGIDADATNPANGFATDPFPETPTANSDVLTSGGSSAANTGSAGGGVTGEGGGGSTGQSNPPLIAMNWLMKVKR